MQREEMQELIRKTAKAFNIKPAILHAFISVESSGQGFGPGGRLLIQFEPAWFRRKEPFAPTGKWSVNKVERQAAEWEAFEDASRHSLHSAMEATSVGMGQILGLHYKRLGYGNVNEMWTDASLSIERQVWQIGKFIATDRRLIEALRRMDWHMVASIYNGPKYREMAAKWGREPYDLSFAKAYREGVKIYGE